MKAPKYKIGTRLVHAIVTKPSASLQALLPVRTLIHVPLKDKAKGGDVLFKNGKPYLLLADHHEHQLAKVLSGLHINTEITISYLVEDIHPVTHMASGKTQVSTLTAPAVLEVGAEVEDNNLSTKKNIYYCGEPLSVEDKINDVRVRKVDLISGVYRAEVY